MIFFGILVLPLGPRPPKIMNVLKKFLKIFVSVENEIPVPEPIDTCKRRTGYDFSVTIKIFTVTFLNCR